MNKKNRDEKRKLRLRRESIRKLQSNELQNAVGGATATTPAYTVTLISNEIEC